LENEVAVRPARPLSGPPGLRPPWPRPRACFPAVQAGRLLRWPAAAAGGALAQCQPSRFPRWVKLLDGVGNAKTGTCRRAGPSPRGVRGGCCWARWEPARFASIAVENPSVVAAVPVSAPVAGCRGR